MLVSKINFINDTNGELIDSIEFYEARNYTTNEILNLLSSKGILAHYIDYDKNSETVDLYVEEFEIIDVKQIKIKSEGIVIHTLVIPVFDKPVYVCLKNLFNVNHLEIHTSEIAYD